MQQPIHQHFGGGKNYHSGMKNDLVMLGKNLKRIMAEQKLSQSELGRRASSKEHNVSQQTISNMLLSYHNPQFDTLLGIAGALNIQVWELLAPPEVRRLIHLYSRADEGSQAAFLQIAESLARSSQDEK